mmetsp:Transcript_50362/g.93138  ORF Transcript_50362/g.93138 Transcript_50362/m.93138 type:complete len:354 (+) Transcript_50362:115-1176(+)
MGSTVCCCGTTDGLPAGVHKDMAALGAAPDDAVDQAYSADPFYARDRVLSRRHMLGLNLLDEFLDEVEFVSLGNYCMLSLALKALGLRSCSYPLDYTRSSTRGLIHLFTTGFADFITGQPITSPEHGVVVQNTAWGGSFWHHDLREPAVRNAMQRRVQRLLGKGSVPLDKPRMFFRTANTTDELDLTTDLLMLLQSTYSGPVKLCTCIELQSGSGPITLAGDLGDDLLFYRISEKYTLTTTQEERIDGFFDPIAQAIQFWSGAPLLAAQVKSVAEVKGLCDTIQGGNPANSLFSPAVTARPVARSPAPTRKQVPPLESGFAFHEVAAFKLAKGLSAYMPLDVNGIQLWDDGEE